MDIAEVDRKAGRKPLGSGDRRNGIEREDWRFGWELKWWDLGFAYDVRLPSRLECIGRLDEMQGLCHLLN
jgi:hypothetical protein